MKTLTLLLCSCLIAAAVQAQIIHVPDDYPTIQLGINAANPGDTVLVSDGTYLEQINFKGKKPLMVASQFLMDGDTSHISNTIITRSQFPNLDSASMVYFVSGEDTSSILCGFTITQGKGTQYIVAGNTFRAGGGVYIASSGAKVIHNHITENHLNYAFPGSAQLVAGAGLFGEYNMEDHWVIVDHNVIDHNSCYSGSTQSIGAGLFICYNALITNNTISDNTCTGVVDATAAGAGFCCVTDLTWTNMVTAIVQHNIIKNNLSEAENNWANSAGGAFEAVTGIFSENEVAYNTVVTGYGSQWDAAGVFMYQPDSGSVVSNNVFQENVSNNGSGGLSLENIVEISNNPVLVENNFFIDNEARQGGAFTTVDVPVTLQNNVFSGNHAENSGGAVYLWDSFGSTLNHLATLVNNTFSLNVATAKGGAIYSEGADQLIFNCIFWQDSAFNGQEIFINYQQASVEIAWSNIDTNKIRGSYSAGYGIMKEDPLFEDSIYLKPWCYSPCIDQGVLGYSCSHGDYIDAPEYDINGVPRPQGLGNDMGAYDTIFSGVGISSVVSRQSSVVSYPNPFSSFTTFEYELDHAAKVNLAIYSHLGQQVAVLVNEQQTKGKHQVQWNAEGLRAGIYYYRLTILRALPSGHANGYRLTTTGKLVIAR